MISTYESGVGNGRHKTTRMNIKERDVSMGWHIASRDRATNPVPPYFIYGGSYTRSPLYLVSTSRPQKYSATGGSWVLGYSVNEDTVHPYGGRY